MLAIYLLAYTINNVKNLVNSFRRYIIHVFPLTRLHYIKLWKVTILCLVLLKIIYDTEGKKPHNDMNGRIQSEAVLSILKLNLI